MFTKLIGYLWIFLGVLWLARPDILKGWFTRKTDWKIMWFVWGMVFLMAFHLGFLALKIKNLFLRQVSFFGIVFLGVVIWMLQSKARAKINHWCQKIPLLYFQVVGCVNIAGGLWMVNYK